MCWFWLLSVNGVQRCDCWRHYFLSLVCVQSVSKVSAGFTSVSSLKLAAFDLVYCLYTVIVYGFLSVLRFVFVLDIKLVIGL